MRVDYITRESLRNFYENFSGLEGDTLEKVATEGYRSMSAVSSFLIFLLCLHKAFRTVTTNWTTRATSCSSQTSCSDEQSMDQVKMFYWQKLTKLNRPIQVNTSSAALTIGTWTSRTRLSTICRSNPNKNGATLTASQSWIKTFSHYGLTLPNNASNTSLDYQGTCVNDRLNKVKDRNVTKMCFPAAPCFALYEKGKILTRFNFL